LENTAAFEVVRLDLAEGELELDGIDGIDGIFHLAGQPGVRSFGPVFADHVRHSVLATQRVFDAAARAGVRVVFASSSSVYGDAERFPTPADAHPQPVSPYGVTKLACEHLADAYVRNFALDVVTLRYFVVYGPRQRPDTAFTRLVEALAAGGTFELYGDGRGVGGRAVRSGLQHRRRHRGDAEPGDQAARTRPGSPLDVRRLPLPAGDARRTCADITCVRRELGVAAARRAERGSPRAVAMGVE
jgi:hypothetical protein